MDRPTNRSAEWRSRSADSDKTKRSDSFVDDAVEPRQNRRFWPGGLECVLAGAGRVILRWRFFLGACLLTGAVLLPYVKAGPVIAGMVLAGLIQIAWSRLTGSQGPGR